MGKFGWSLPPGCSTLPGEEDSPCYICGKMVDDCICHECPSCGSYGDPYCYMAHGLVKTPEQVASLAEAEKQWGEASKADQEYWEEYAQDHGLEQK